MSHILLVDDDESFRHMLCLTLTKLGHKVTEAQNGKQALALQQRVGAELVITDLIMPEKEGIETIEELRELNPGIKIIAMSGGGRVSASDYLKIAKAMGADAVLAKPFSNDELKLALFCLAT